MNTRIKFAAAAAAALLALGSLAGCSGGTGDKGGQTTCGEFKSLSDSAKDTAITKMLQDAGQPLEAVQMTKGLIGLYCLDSANANKTIDSIAG